MYEQSHHQRLRPGYRHAGLLLIFLIHLIIAGPLSHAQSTYQKPIISYKNNLLTLSAKDADLKNVLFRLADKTHIHIRFPDILNRKITIKKRGISLREALHRLLKGLNYAVIYSGPSKNRSLISEVFVFKKSSRPGPLTGAERRIVNRLRAYENRMESLNRNLSTIDQNSRRGKSLMRQIRILEKSIQRLEIRLNRH